MKKLIILFSVLFLTTGQAEDGAWVFLQQSPPDELVTGVESGSLTAPMVLGGELVFDKSYIGVRKILASDGTVLGSYTKIQNTPITGLGGVKDNFGVINGNYIVKGSTAGTLVSWDGVSEVATVLTPPEVTQIGVIIQCDPDDLVGGQVYFSARTDDNGGELWVTTGTAADTFMVADINSGSESGFLGGFNNSGLTLCNGSNVLFRGDNGVNGRELFNASRAGVSMIRDSLSGSSDGFDGNLKQTFGGNYLYAGVVPCDVNDPCSGSSFPYGTTWGVIRAFSGPGYGNPLKLRNPDESMIDFREGLVAGETYGFSTSKVYLHDGFGGVAVINSVLGRPRNAMHFPDFTILQTDLDSNNNNGNGGYILTGLTENYVPNLAGINFSYTDTFTPYDNGYVFYSRASSGPSSYYFTDGTVGGSFQIVSGVSGNQNPTVFGDSIYYSTTNGGVGIKRYGPAKDPEIGFLGSVIVNEDSNSGGPFIVGGSVTTFADLAVTADSLDDNLISDMDISFYNSTSQIRSFSVSPLPNQYGDAEIELTVEDHRGWTSSITVPVTIRPVNDEPSFDFVTTEVRIPINTAGTFVFENFITNIDFGPNESHQMVDHFIADVTPSFIDEVTISPDGTLSIATTGGSGSAATVYVQMFDNGGTEHGGNNVSQQKTFTVFAQPPVDVEVIGQYIGTNGANHVFEYTVTNTSSNIDLTESDLIIDTLSTQMTNVITTCISNCAETINGPNASFAMALNNQTTATIQVTGEFDINANPGVIFNSLLRANVVGTQLDDNTDNNEVMIEMPQIIFSNGFE